MALNFMGLGFSFGAKDDGLRKMQKDIHQGFKDINEELDRYAKRTSKKVDKALDEFTDSLPSKKVKDTTKSLEGMSDAFEKKMVQASERSAKALEKQTKVMEKVLGGVETAFGKVGEGVTTLKKILGQAKLQTLVQAMGLDKLQQGVGNFLNRVNAGINLADAIEDEFAGLNKQSRALGANYGYTGEKLKEFSGKASSMAYSMKMSVDTTGQAIRAMDELGRIAPEATEAMNLSAKTLAKLQEAGLVNADIVRDSVLMMNEQLGLSPGAIDRVVDSYYAMGEATGNVNAAMATLPALNDKLARMKAMGATAEQMESFARQSAAISAGLFQFGQNSEQSRQQMEKLQETLISGREGFQDLLVGVNNQLPDFQQKLMNMAGDAGVAFDTMQQGPEEFMLGMTDIVRHMKKTGQYTVQQQTWISSRMRDMFGDAAPAMLNFMENADEATLAVMDSTRNAVIDLEKKANDAFRTGMSLAERWQRVQDRFAHGFNKIARPAARDFVRETGKEFDVFNKKMRGIAEDGGPLGMFVEKISLASQLGAHAFIPQALRPMSALFGKMMESVGPSAAALGAFGVRVDKLLNPVSLLAVGIGGVALAFHSSEKRFKKNIETMADSKKAMRAEEKALKGLRKKLDKATEGTDEYAKLKAQIQKKEYNIKTAKAIKTEEDAIAGLTKQMEKAKKQGKDYSGLQAQIQGHEKNLATIREGMAKQAREESKQRIRDFAQKAKEMVQGFVTALPEIVRAAIDFMKTDFIPLAMEIIPAMQDMFNIVWDAVSSIKEEDVNKVTNWLIGTVDRALEFVGSVPWGEKFSAFFSEAGSFVEAVFMGTGDENTLSGRLGNTIHKVGAAAIGVAWDLTKAAAGAWWTRFTESWRDIDFNRPIGDVMSQIGDAMLDSAAVIGMTIATAMFLSPGIRKLVVGGLKKMLMLPFGGVGNKLKVEFQQAVPTLQAGIMEACASCAPSCGGGYGAGGYGGGAGVGGPGGRKGKKGRRRGGRRRGKLGRVADLGGRGVSAVSRTGRRGLGAVRDVGGRGLGKVKQLGGRGLQKAGALGKRGMGAAKRGAGALRGKGGLLLGGGLMAWDAYDMMAMGGEMEPADVALQGGLMAYDVAEMADAGAGAFKGASKSLGMARTATKGTEAAITSTAAAVETTAQTTLQASTRLGKVGATAMKGLGAAARVGSKALPLVGGLIEGGFAAYNITQRWDEAKNGYEQAALVNEELGMAMVSFGTAGIADLVGFREMVPGMQDSMYGAMESTHEFFAGASSGIKEFTDGWVDLSKGYDIVADLPVMGALLPELGDFSGTREEKARIREAKRSKMTRERLASSMMVRSKQMLGKQGGFDITKQGAMLNETVKALEGMADLTGEINILQAKSFGGMVELSAEDQARLKTLEDQKLQYLGMVKATTNLSDHNLAALYHMEDANELRSTGNRLMLDYMEAAKKAGVSTEGLVEKTKEVDDGLMGWSASLLNTNNELAKAEALMQKQAETLRKEKEEELKRSFEMIGAEQKRYMESVKQYELLQGVIANEQTSEQDRIRAQEKLMKLRMDMGTQGAGMLQDMEAMVAQGAMTADQFEKAKALVTGINEQFALGTKDAEGYGVMVSSIVSPNMDERMMTANIDDMIRTLEERGADAWKNALVLDEGQVAQAMNFVSGESKQKLEEYATLLEQKRTQHEGNLADMMATLQNQASLNGMALSQEALANIADNMTPTVDQFKAAVMGMENFSVTTPVKVVYKQDEEGNVLKDENGEPIELSVSGGMTWDQEKIEKNRERLQQLWDAGTLEQELGLQPITTEEFLNTLPSVKDNPEAMKQLQDRLGLGMLINPEQAQAAAQTFMGAFSAEEMNFDFGTAITGDMEAASAGMEAFATKATEQLGIVVGAVDEHFGNSQHDVINADFDAAYLGIESFTNRSLAQLNLFREGVNGIFTGLWSDVLVLTDQVITAMTLDVESVAADIYTIASSLDALANAKVEAAQAKVNAQAAAPALSQEYKDDSMVEAIHQPFWYMEMADARLAALGAKLDKILAELRGGAGGRTRGGGTTNSALLRQQMNPTDNAGAQTAYQTGGGRR